MESADPLVAGFITAAVAPQDGTGHATGTLEHAQYLLDAHPHIARAGIHTAAILGDAAGVQHFLTADSSSATAKGGPYRWDALTCLCFSRYLRLDRSRADGFTAAATALLHAGANANTGWWEESHQPEPVWESVLYGAAGVAHHPGVTRVLLEHGADPNDVEVTYHTPETRDNDALKLVVGTGKLTKDSLATMLLRKTDWHDYEGIKWLLSQGVDPNEMTQWGKTSMHNAALSDNALRIFEVLLDHGADPALVAPQTKRGSRTPAALSSAAILARRGRADVLELFKRRGLSVHLTGEDRLLAACAMDDGDAVRTIARDDPEAAAKVVAGGGQTLAEFAGNDNAAGIGHLLNLGVPVSAPFVQGDGYWNLAKNSTALHAAAWRMSHAALKLLLGRGASPSARDAGGRTPLMLAVKACVDSYWSAGRSLVSIEALLHAGASVKGITIPTGYPEADQLLQHHSGNAPQDGNAPDV